MTNMKEYRDRLKYQADKFRRELDAIMQACDCIKDLEQCDNCPLKSFCLEKESLACVWSELSIIAIAEFLEYSDDICNAEDEEMTDEDWEAIKADEARKAEIEIKDIDEYYK